MEEVYQASYKWNFSVENGRTLMISWRFQTWGSGRMMLLQAEKKIFFSSPLEVHSSSRLQENPAPYYFFFPTGKYHKVPGY